MMDYTLSATDRELIDLLWDYMKKDPEHKDRVRTGYGTKTKFGLCRSIEAILKATGPKPVEPKAKKGQDVTS